MDRHPPSKRRTSWETQKEGGGEKKTNPQILQLNIYYIDIANIIKRERHVGGLWCYKAEYEERARVDVFKSGAFIVKDRFQDVLGTGLTHPSYPIAADVDSRAFGRQ